MEYCCGATSQQRERLKNRLGCLRRLFHGTLDSDTLQLPGDLRGVNGIVSGNVQGMVADGDFALFLVLAAPLPLLQRESGQLGNVLRAEAMESSEGFAQVRGGIVAFPGPGILIVGRNNGV